MKIFYKFKKGKQKKLLEKAINKAGSERKLARLTNLPKGSLSDLKLEKRNLSYRYAKEICNFLKINTIDMDYESILPSNWGQIKGGKNLIKMKIERGILDETIERLKVATNKRLKEWHKYMKENEPERYYKWQYDRFKKIGRGYRFSLNNGIKVRNHLEKEVGNYLLKHFKSIEYEPYINIKGKAYFPDFKYGNVLIEVTEWKHPTEQKIKHLKEKCKNYQEEGYIICFFIPRLYRKFYKFLKSPVITNLSDLKQFINASIA